MRSRWIAALTVMLLSVAAYATTAPAFSAPRLALTQQQDSMTAQVSWRTACDLRGCADSTRVTWRIGALAPTVRTTRATMDQQRFRAPAYGDSVEVRVSLESFRRKTISAPVVVTMYAKRLDAPPPPPDSVKLDTVRVDSVRLTAYNPRSGAAHSGPLLIAEGDSLLFVARLYMRTGYPRRTADSIAWLTAPVPGMNTATVTIRKLDVIGDSAMLVARDCGCRESGDFLNRPHLTPTGWRKRAPSGQWVPVTPRHGLAPHQPMPLSVFGRGA